MASAPMMMQAPVTASDIATQEALRDAASGIVDRLTSLSREQVRKRQPLERRWLEDKRLYHGKLEPDMEEALREAKQSRATIGLARSKSNAWAARLGDMLFPADEKNWGIGPTPVPTLTDGAKAAAAQAEQLEAQAADAVEQASRANDVEGQPPQVTGQHLAKAHDLASQALTARDAEATARTQMDEAAKRSDAMEREIDDQLVECKYPARSRRAIMEAVQLGPGILKGPVVGNRGKRSWEIDETGAARLTNSPDPAPEFRWVDIWSFFPQMDATSMEDCEFVFERHLPNKTMLRKMARTLDFDQTMVAELLEAGPGHGVSADLKHLTDLRSITGEGEAIADRYVLWEYHGRLECDEICTLLRAVGRHDDADQFDQDHGALDDLVVKIYFCDGRLLRIDEIYPLDSCELMYSVFPFEEGEASVLGAIGIPRIITNSVRAAIGAWRMMLDNGGLSTGPQIVIDKSRITPQDNDYTLKAMKIWLATGADITNNPAFSVFNIPSNQQELAGIIEIALKFIDEEAGLPMLAQGEQGPATQTMGGMSMLFNAANVMFRRVVRNFDDHMTTPNIRRLYDWNMQFNRKAEVKGDMQVEARGTSVLLVRELLAMHLSQILMAWAEHPLFGTMLKAYEGASMYLQSLSLTPESLLLSKDEFEAKAKQMAEASQGQQSPEEIRAQAMLEAAKISAASSKEDGQVRLQIADIQRQTELVRLASQENMTIADLQAALQIKRIETDSKERIFAGEVGAESQMAREARAHGQEPKGSGGYVSQGSYPEANR